MWTDLFTFLWKANLSLLLFWLLYRSLLHTWTFYKLNRWFWIFALTFSVLYPWLPGLEWVSVNIQTILIQTGDAPAGAAGVSEAGIPWEEIAYMLFWVSVAVFLLRLAIRVLAIWNVHRKSQAAQWQTYRFRESSEPIAPFSFFKSTYIHSASHTFADLKKILEHERVHVKQWHSLDCLLIDLLLSLFWYNPAIWFIRRSIYLNLEYITDQEVLNQGADREQYQYSLLRIGTGVQVEPGLSFNYGNLKQRIMRMNRKNSGSSKKALYLMVLPLVVLLSSLTALPSLAGKQSEIRVVLIEPDSREVVFGDTVQADSGSRVIRSGSIKVTPRDTSEEGSQFKRVTIRKSKQTGDPLYVIDGKPVENARLKDLDPDNIQAINVYKDSTAIKRYGEAGINGVIEITMKPAQKKPATRLKNGDIRVEIPIEK